MNVICDRCGRTAEVVCLSKARRHVHVDHVCAGIAGFPRANERREPWESVLDETEVQRLRGEKNVGDRSVLANAVSSQVQQAASDHRLMLHYERLESEPTRSDDANQGSRSNADSACWKAYTQFIGPSGLLTVSQCESGDSSDSATSDRLSVRTSYFPNVAISVDADERFHVIAMKRRRQHAQRRGYKLICPTSSVQKTIAGNHIRSIVFDSPENWGFVRDGDEWTAVPEIPAWPESTLCVGENAKDGGS